VVFFQSGPKTSPPVILIPGLASEEREGGGLIGQADPWKISEKTAAFCLHVRAARSYAISRIKVRSKG